MSKLLAVTLMFINQKLNKIKIDTHGKLGN